MLLLGPKAPTLGFGSVLIFTFCVAFIAPAQIDFAKRMHVL